MCDFEDLLEGDKFDEAMELLFNSQDVEAVFAWEELLLAVCKNQEMLNKCYQKFTEWSFDEDEKNVLRQNILFNSIDRVEYSGFQHLLELGLHPYESPDNAFNLCVELNKPRLLTSLLHQKPTEEFEEERNLCVREAYEKALDEDKKSMLVILGPHYEELE